MSYIIPAILPQSLEELGEKLSDIRGIASLVQIDIVDGRFAPDTTWPCRTSLELGALSLEEKIQFPFADEFEFEMDLMVEEPLEMAERFIAAGAKRVLIHADALGALEAATRLNLVGCELGVALPCAGTMELLDGFTRYDYVQVMGIEKIGFQGQPFDERAVHLVRGMREKFPGLTIQVDGGVNEETIPALVRAGATRLVVGSRIWQSAEPKGEIEKLRMLANAV